MAKKPIHFEAKPKENMTMEEMDALWDIGIAATQDKLDALSPHFGDDVKLTWHATVEDGGINFYVGVKVDF